MAKTGRIYETEVYTPIRIALFVELATHNCVQWREQSDPYDVHGRTFICRGYRSNLRTLMLDLESCCSSRSKLKVITTTGQVGRKALQRAIHANLHDLADFRFTRN
jgi:hypothetical protein